MQTNLQINYHMKRKNCNWYYVSNVFKLNDPNSEKDNPNDYKNENYNTHVRIMTYGNPR